MSTRPRPAWPAVVVAGALSALGADAALAARDRLPDAEILAAKASGGATD